MTTAFEPLTVGNVTIPNRIWLSPMCMYSCSQDGIPGDFHLVHYGALALGGFGLIITEATAVTAEGRLSMGDCGIWNDEQLSAWQPIVDFCHAQGAVMGIQLAHAGRKSRGNGRLLAPSAVAFPGYDEPLAMTEQDLDDVVEAFAAGARRAVLAGFDVIEIHAAHGYLLHEFLSPLSNQRDDEYGGSLTHRARLLLRVIDAVRPLVPGALLVRISATDWTPDGLQAEESRDLAVMLREHGVDLIDVSTGGNVVTDIPTQPLYQIPAAATVREAGLPVAGVGLITSAAEVDQALQSVDACLIARAALRDPHFPQRVAKELGAQIPAPRQYICAW